MPRTIGKYVRGAAEVKRNLRIFGGLFPKAIGVSLQEEGAEAILGKTSVPVDTGDLKSSAYVSRVEKTGIGSEVTVGFKAAHGKFVNAKTRFFSKRVKAAERGYLGRIATRVEKNLYAQPHGEREGVPTKTARKRRKK